MSGFVLIETYWNVKADNTGLRPAFCSINRNILECKERSRIRLTLLYNVLIETYWNVKIRVIWKDLVLDLSINRNILECKD